MVRLELKPHLAERTQIKAIRLGVSRAGIHVIPQQQHQLQQAAKGAALPDFITGGVYSQDIWAQVVYLLLKLYPEEDVAEARTQPLHAAHLGKDNRNGARRRKKIGKGKVIQKRMKQESRKARVTKNMSNRETKVKENSQT